MKSHTPPYNSSSSMNKGMADVQKYFIGRPQYYFFDSVSFLSESTISIKCVLFLMWIPSTLLSIHLSNSGDNLTPIYSFTTSNTMLQRNTNEHINTCFTLSTFVKHCHIIMNEGEMSECELLL